LSLGGLVCVYDLVDISNRTADVFGTDVQVASPGWGICLGLAGCVAVESLPGPALSAARRNSEAS